MEAIRGVNMSEKIINEIICLKQCMSENDYKEISQLEQICCSCDKTNLKLELDYRFNMRMSSEIGLKEVNEFMYYVEDTLAAYICIGSFGGSNIAEVNGMTHPDFRRNGLFKRLFGLAMEECKKRNFKKILLLSDGNSKSGIEFINSVGGEYDFSEYRMKALNKTAPECTSPVRLRKVGKLDGKEIARQNAVYFNHSREFEWSPEKDEEQNIFTYLVELEGRVIGKIVITYDDNSAFISGFGIMPDFRSKGYGKAALKEAMRLINERNIYDVELDVESKNNNALNLYKVCGFKEQSVMSYYRYII